MDAMGCQKKIAEKIIEAEADYLLALKQNQGSLYEQVDDYFTKHKAHLAPFEQRDKGHGRAELRRVYLSQELVFLEEVGQWPSCKSIVMLESIRADKKEQKSSIRYYISSLAEKKAAAYADYVRGHWGIENGLHWQLDVTFGEDQSQIRKDNGPQNMAILRKLALHLLAKEDSKMSLKRKRKKAARDNTFLLKVLNLS